MRKPRHTNVKLFALDHVTVSQQSYNFNPSSLELKLMVLTKVVYTASKMENFHPGYIHISYYIIGCIVLSKFLNIPCIPQGPVQKMHEYS